MFCPKRQLSPEQIDQKKKKEVVAAMAWQKRNPEKFRENVNRYRKARYHRDPNFRLQFVLRQRIRNAIGGQRSQATNTLLGCTVEQLKLHIETQFKDGMNWDNHGKYGWHIDHIRPCSSFDLTDPEQQKTCFHYTNLQPLWAEDNLKKGFDFTETCRN